MNQDSLDLSGYKVSPLTLTFLIREDKVLTLKRRSDKQIYPNKVSGFGGKVEPGEDLFSSAKREFFEETGLTLKTFFLRGLFIRIMDTGYFNQMYLFVARDFEGELKAFSDEGEITWLPLDDFVRRDDVVDHIPLYFHQIVSGRDFYCGVGVYVNGKMTTYINNKSHFEERR